MDHDSVPLHDDGPSSHRKADVRDAYLRLTRHGLEAMGSRIEAESAYSSNDEGHFAWDVSLAIRAAACAWRVTGDTTHLAQAASWAQHVCERTDAARGITDWRGESAAVWSAGPRYTAGDANVGTLGDVPVHVQAAADSVRIERPSSTTAILHTLKAGEIVWSSPEASLLPDEDNYLPDLLARRSTVRSPLVHGLAHLVDLTGLEAGEHQLTALRAPHLVHTGMIARSLLAAADALEDAGPAQVPEAMTPTDLYEAAELALSHHDEDIRVNSGQAWYVTPVDFPGRRLGMALPHNQVVDAATSFLLLGARKSDEGLRDLGRSFTRRFLREIDLFRQSELTHPWHYYPVDSDVYRGVERERPIAERVSRPIRRDEDSSHATMRIRAFTEWKAIDSSLVPDDVLTEVALSFRRHYMTTRNGISTLRWVPSDPKGAPQEGASDTYAGAWGALAPWDSTMRRRINSIAYRHPPVSVFGATVLSSAEILAMDSTTTYASSGRSARA